MKLAAKTPTTSHLETLVHELRELEARLLQGGGADRIQRQHEQHKLTARARHE